mmetsp:Transcript_19908/g.75230  ORF Transcript_19908/g.75230 Transcript_19908/m.75230 type:complete len:144 (-) Transcript_19908:32-463(-)
MANKEAANNTGATPLYIAAQKGHPAVVQALLHRAANKEAVEKCFGATPLNVAAFSGHLQVVRALLRHGADMNTASMNGWTPLKSAACEGHQDVVQFLLEHSDGVTNLPAIESALQAASDADQHDVVSLLIDAKIKIVEKVKKS